MYSATEKWNLNCYTSIHYNPLFQNACIFLPNWIFKIKWTVFLIVLIILNSCWAYFAKSDLFLEHLRVCGPTIFLFLQVTQNGRWFVHFLRVWWFVHLSILLHFCGWSLFEAIVLLWSCHLCIHLRMLAILLVELLLVHWERIVVRLVLLFCDFKIVYL